jgi:EAL domain-containing protein (putative c-di-GMP-specific phosphodiesterase class I)
VETREQADFLVKQGCDVLQGFLFARPMVPEAFFSFANAPRKILLSSSPREDSEIVS